MKITQEQAASKMATSASMISRLERGGGRSEHSPSLNTLRNYAEAVGYQFDILFYEKEEGGA